MTTLHFPEFQDALRLSNPNGTLNPEWKKLSIPPLVCNNASDNHRKLWPFAICDAVCSFGSQKAITEMLESKIFEETSKSFLENLDKYSMFFPNLLALIELRKRLPDDLVCLILQKNQKLDTHCSHTFPKNYGTPLFVCNIDGYTQNHTVLCIYMDPVLFRSYLYYENSKSYPDDGNTIAIQQFAKLFANSENPNDPLNVINRTTDITEYCWTLFGNMNKLFLKGNEVELELAFLRKYLEKTSPDTLANCLVPDETILAKIKEITSKFDCNCRRSKEFLKQYEEAMFDAEINSISVEEFEQRQISIMNIYSEEISEYGSPYPCKRHTLFFSTMVLWISGDEGFKLSNQIKQKIIQNPQAKKSLRVMIKLAKSYHTTSRFFALSTIKLWEELKKNSVRSRPRRRTIPLSSLFGVSSDSVEDAHESENDGEDFI